jgi:hypothetical protein
MARLLGSVLSPADLPWAELQAARLDGELFPLAGAFCPVDELEGPRHRAHAVLGRRSPRLIPELGTAAWIWGAAPEPENLEFAVTPDARARLSPDQRVTVREIVFGPGDLIDLDGVRVTTAVRTAVDLARFQHPFTPETVARLAAVVGFALTDCLALLDSRSGIPSKKRAVRNLAAALGPSTTNQAVDTRYTS